MTVPVPQVSEDSREVVRGVDELGNLVFKQVGVEEVSYLGRWGARTVSGTLNTIGIGEKVFVLDFDPEKTFRVGDDVLCVAPDRDCFMWGSIIQRTDDPDHSPSLTVFVDDISNAQGTFADWELQVVGRPKFAITKDSSTSSVDPTAAGPFTLTVTADKFFPIGGKLLMVPIEAPEIALVGLVKAYSGTTLVVEKNSTNATVSQAYTSWSIALLDAPQNAIPFYQINGLRVKINASDPANDIDVLAGSVRDSTDTVDLILSSNLRKRLDAAFAVGTNQGAYTQSASLAGTVSSAGLLVTGTGTAFTTDFGATATDYVSQYAVWKGAAPAVEASIVTTADGNSAAITPITATSAGTDAALLASNDTYKRGGVAAALGSPVTYAICVGRRDTDGHTDVFAAALSGSGTPDLPSGFTYYRVIAKVQKIPAGISLIEQPLHGIGGPTDVEVLVDTTNFVGPVSGAETLAEALALIDDDLGLLHDSATTANAGLVELATSAETITGTDTDRAVTPAGLAAKISDGLTTAGQLLSSSQSAGVGYTTGAGGTVTQIGGKAASVALNRMTGTITTHAAALAANTEVQFTFNNSQITANDSVIVNHRATGTGNYLIQATDVVAGSCVISIRNLTAGSLSQALGIKFTVIRGVAS